MSVTCTYSRIADSPLQNGRFSLAVKMSKRRSPFCRQLEIIHQGGSGSSEIRYNEDEDGRIPSATGAEKNNRGDAS
jgi:hypothetical protein